MKHKNYLGDYLKLKNGAMIELRSSLDRFPCKSVDMSDESLCIQLCLGGAEEYDSWQIMKVTKDFILVKNEYEEYRADYIEFTLQDLDFIMDNMPEPDGD